MLNFHGNLKDRSMNMVLYTCTLCACWLSKAAAELMTLLVFPYEEPDDTGSTSTWQKKQNKTKHFGSVEVVALHQERASTLSRESEPLLLCC